MKKWFMSLTAFALSFGVLGACNMAGDNDANDDTENMRYENVRYNDGDNRLMDNNDLINDQLGDRDNDGVIDYDNQEPDLGEEPNEDPDPAVGDNDNNRLRNINDYRDGNMDIGND